MSGARMKTLVIVALCLINLFFIGFIIYDGQMDARAERQALENVRAVLNAGGIDLNIDGVTRGELRTVRTTRSAEAEARIAEAVLGPAVMTDQGGGIYSYESNIGTAVFYSGGDFEIRLTSGNISVASPDDDRAFLDEARNLLRVMRLETAPLLLERRTAAYYNVTVTTNLSHRGANVFNGTIRFNFRDGTLLLITGSHASWTEFAEGAGEMTSSATALLEFLTWARAGNTATARIERVEAGYQHHVVLFGEGMFTPAWVLTSDTGQRYIVDDEIGTIIRAQ